MKIKVFIRKSILTILATALFLAGYYVVYLYCGYQRIPDWRTPALVEVTEEKTPTGEELTLITYNVGFGAYSADYSFFMDGGEYSRALSSDAVRENIGGAIDVVKAENPDFILLQEVDVDGTRSYNIDQSALFGAAFESHESAFSVNYDSPYYLYPLKEPIGKNKSGIMTFSRYNIGQAWRRQLPVEDSLHKYLDLDRAYSVTRITTDCGKFLSIYNLHLSAYSSDGSIAEEQLKILMDEMLNEYKNGRFVVAVGDFNKDLLGNSGDYFERRDEDYNWSQPINTELIPEGFTVYAPTNAPSCRNADRAYVGDGSDFVVTVDGIIASANITVLSCETIDTGFAYSDHNPVKCKIILGEPKAAVEEK